MDLTNLQRHLQKMRPQGYKRGKKQSDDRDRQTNFIYQTRSFAELQEQVTGFDDGLRHYAMNRRYNFWSAKGVEQIFTTHPTVHANTNEYDKLVDFTIEDIDFDHKTSIFPRAFGQDLTYAQSHKQELIRRFYDNQSQEQRKHLHNRIFVVVYAHDGGHRKIKADLKTLQTHIDDYMHNFHKESLTQLNFGDGQVLSDIIWIVV